MTDKEKQLKKDAKLKRAAELRARAEARPGAARPSSTSMTQAEMDDLIRELQTHQIELELQNEDLIASQAAALSAGEEYTELFEAAPTGYVTTSAKGLVTRCNRAFEQMSNRPRQDIVGRRMEEFIALDDRDAFYLKDLAARETNAAQTCELRLTGPDEMQRWVRIDSLATLDGEGKPAAVKHSIVDVSERIKLEGKLKQRALDLQRARRLESLGLLAGGVAHDFNNLLTPILLHAELSLQESPDEGSLHEALEQIISVSHRGKRLVQRLLAFGSNIVLELRSINLYSALLARQDIMRRLVREDIDFVFPVDDKGLFAPVDESRLDQLLLNLCMNSQEAMPSGGTITFDIFEASAADLAKRHEADDADDADDAERTNHDFVVLRVADTGTGMTDEVASQAFEPFFSTKNVHQGGGLGLATVHGIIRQHNGWVDLKTQPGHGTCLDLYFPKGEMPAPARHSRAAPQGESAQGETILLVEDEESVRAVACRVLQREGYTVLTSESGPDGLALATKYEGRIDLVLTDVVMPHMSGYELASELREVRRDVKVLFMTGYAGDAFPSGEAPAGGDPILNKPFSLSDLREAVRAALSPEGDES